MKSDSAQKGAPEKMERSFCSMRGVLKSGLTTDQWLDQTRDRGEIQLEQIDTLRESLNSYCSMLLREQTVPYVVSHKKQ